ncbi:MAG: hypothetical protein RR135_01255 [Oscillospiraceae bacterium]
MMELGKSLLCVKCHCPLQIARVDFVYLGHSFHTDLPRCPSCGAVYVSKELADGRMSDVEVQLEDK